MIYTFLLLLLVLPGTLSAQTWQKVGEAVAQSSLTKASSFAANRSLLQQSYHQINSYYSQPAIRTWIDTRLSPIEPVESVGTEISWADLSNRLMLKDYAQRAKQLEFFFNKHQELPPSVLDIFPANSSVLPSRIGDKTHFVVVGGPLSDPAVMASFKEMVLQYKLAFPTRQIIVLTESLPDTGEQFFVPGAALESERKWVQFFIKNQIWVAGLADRSSNPEGYFKQANSNLLLSAVHTPAAYAVSSLHMYRRISSWKKRYPDAIFFIYTRAQTAAYDWRYSLANSLPDREIFCISITSIPNTRKFLFHRWRNFQDARAGILVWKEKEWTRASGFDAQIILP